MFFVVVFVVCLFFPPKLSVLNRCSPRWQPQERKERDGVESKLWSCCLCGRQQRLVLDQVWRTFADR